MIRARIGIRGIGMVRGVIRIGVRVRDMIKIRGRN